MINAALYKRGLRRSALLLAVLCAVTAMYIWIIISMFQPETAKMLDEYARLMPELMAAVGMTAGATTLIAFMCSYLYGFILPVFPMLFCIVRANALIAGQVDNCSMVSLLAAPVKRRTIVLTQLVVLLSGILILDVFSTVLEIIGAEFYFPGELDVAALLLLNIGLLFLHLFIGGICFLASCLFSDAKRSLGFGAGIPILMYVLKMLSNLGGNAENAKYFTFFTLFDPNGIVAGNSGAITGMIVLLIGAVILFTAGIAVFCRKDLNI